MSDKYGVIQEQTLFDEGFYEVDDKQDDKLKKEDKEKKNK